MSTQTVDFKELKARISIEQVLPMIGARLKGHGPQMRGPCPICKSGGDRALVVTPSKGLFYCFGQCKKGGDIIALVALARDCSLKDAAREIDTHFGAVPRSPDNGGRAVPDTVHHGSPQPTQKEGFKALDYLLPSHEALEGLGVAPETLQEWKAGFAPKGILRGRLALPIYDRKGVLVAYTGRAVRDESPVLTFPNGFDAHAHLIGVERVTSGPLYLVRDPLQVLSAYENGIENVVSFLTEGITAQQLEGLASLMDERQCDTVELF